MRRAPQPLVTGKGKELDVFVAGGDLFEEPRGILVAARRPSLRAQQRLYPGELLGKQFADELAGHLAPVLEDAFRAADPLPDLGARDLRGGGVLHQVEHRHAAVAREPGADVLDADTD